MNRTGALALKISGIAVSIIAILGNALVTYIIVRIKNMKTSMNYIILNIAVLDTLTGFFTIYYQLTNDYDEVLGSSVLKQAYNESTVLAEVLCKVETLTYLGTSISPLLLTAMAYERYKAIVHPLSRLNSEVTKARLKWILALSWVWGVGYAIFDMCIIQYYDEENYCDDQELRWYSYAAYEVVYTTIHFIITSIAMFVFYLKVIIALRKQVGALASQSAAQKARAKARRKVIRIILVVTLTFYICCGVPHILYAIHLQFYKILTVMQVEAYFDDIYFLLLCFNSAFNPFVYFIFLKSFRKGFIDAFKTTNSKINRPPVASNGTNRSFSLEHIDDGKSRNSNGIQLVQLTFRD